MTSRNGYFPGKTKAKGSAIITPRTAQETQIAAMPRQSRAARQALAKTPPLRVGGDGLVEGADRIMRTPTEHQAAGVAFKVARIYLRVSTDEQDLTRQAAIVESTRAAGFYVAVNTVLPRRDSGWMSDPAHEQQRLEYNQMVRANSIGADAVIDVARDPALVTTALDALADYGRPRAVRLAVLVDGRLLPFARLGTELGAVARGDGPGVLEHPVGRDHLVDDLERLIRDKVREKQQAEQDVIARDA